MTARRAPRDVGQETPERPSAARGVLLEPNLDLGVTEWPFKQSERSFMGQVLTYARLMGWRIFHDSATNTARRCSACGAVRGTPRNAAGLPDLILVRRPRVVWAELKSQRGKATEDQRDWLDDLRASGQHVYLWRPSDWPEIEKVLR
jgi:hypothetical protein